MHRLLFSRIGCTLQPIVSTEKCSVEKHERMTYGFQLVGHRLATSSVSAVWGQCSHTHTNMRTHANTQTQARYRERYGEREGDMTQTDGRRSRKDNHFFELSCAIWVMLLKTGVQVSKPDPPEPCLPGSLFFCEAPLSESPPVPWAMTTSSKAFHHPGTTRCTVSRSVATATFVCREGFEIS